MLFRSVTAGLQWAPDTNPALCWDYTTTNTSFPGSCMSGYGFTFITTPTFQWEGAKEYCANYNGGGWRLPTSAELVTALNTTYGGAGVQATGLPGGFTTFSDAANGNALTSRTYWASESTTQKAAVANWVATRTNPATGAYATPLANYFSKNFNSGTTPANNYSVYFRCVK